MVIASSKNAEMTFFFLSDKYPLTLKDLPDGRFYTKDWLLGCTLPVPNGCVPFWCEYTGDWTNEGHSWTNLRSGQVHTTHPLGLKFIVDNSFTEGFYEITAIEGITFGEGEAWDPDTNQKIRIEKLVPMSIWNPFFQRYDPPCNKHFFCKGVKKVMKPYSDCGSYLYLDMFTECRELFFEVYCRCGLEDSREHHTDSDSN